MMNRKPAIAMAIVASLIAVAAIAIFYGDNQTGIVEVKYGDDPKQTLDICPADGRDARPIVMFIHGGGWASGDKIDGRKYADLIRDSNCVYVSLNYRFMNGSIHTEEMLDDVHVAVSFLKEHASEYKIDTKRMGVMGFSAGAHLSLMYAYGGTSPIPVDFVVSCSGPTDFTNPEFYRHAMETGWLKEDALVNLIWNLTGTKYTIAELLSQTKENHINDTERISPLFKVGPGSPKTIIVHSEKDEAITIKVADSLSDKLKESGVEYNFYRYTHSYHGLNDVRDHDHNVAYLDKLREFSRGLGR